MTNSTNVLEALVFNNRSELSKTFGVGLFVSEADTLEQVIEKCETYVVRYKTYVTNLEIIINSDDALVSEMKKAKVRHLFSSLDENEKRLLRRCMINLH